ncbi:aminoglycoside 3'-phosphotransferase [Actinosynnema pretiosum subsp. pretiosum]|uniref:Aminoglycoside 3'-phosphotransferase n=1 Tax=Actinosynnema pretiosum subsp. pretiosum TaxID=103721 RepID=A0AA45L9Y2_9PSEU|nr:Aminoglycoside 3'-phosphotransferase [Actinosynnema pretiosum subsp. pretiosum]QUF06389.1 aminoglycoside 3'-phosphotransferase [Actinosynnema pretiosum subsp. pretiosum]
MDDWTPVTTGLSGARVRRSPDGRHHRKTSADVTALAAERDRLLWLATTPVGAPEVVDWSDTGALVTTTLPGTPASDLPPTAVPAAIAALLAFLDVLHALPDCPFDRRLAITVPEAAAHVAAGLVDESDFDAPRLGRTAPDLLDLLRAGHDRAAAHEERDLAVCHGDFSLPNVLLDPDTLGVTGILDVGRLGLADRHQDLALLARSAGDPDLNPAYGATPAAHEVLARTDPWRVDYYQLLDEFF